MDSDSHRSTRSGIYRRQLPPIATGDRPELPHLEIVITDALSTQSVLDHMETTNHLTARLTAANSDHRNQLEEGRRSANHRRQREKVAGVVSKCR